MTRRGRRWLALASSALLLAVVALAVAASGGGSASASSPQPRHHPSAQGTAGKSKVRYSQGFDIDNKSKNDIKLINITGDGNFEGRPADGTVVKPDGSTHVEVQFRAASNQEDSANFDILGADGKSIGTFKAHMRVDFVDGWWSYCETTVGSCTPVAVTNPYYPVTPYNQDIRTIVLNAS